MSDAHLREDDYRNLAESLPQLAWIAEADGNIVWYNQRWYDYTGTTLETMRGWGWRSVHHPTTSSGSRRASAAPSRPASRGRTRFR